MRAREFVTESVDITQDVRGHHHGQTDIRLTARTSNGVAGYLDYSEWRGEVRINMINVMHKRQGVGTALVKELQRLYPATEIDWGMTTPEGTELYKALQFDEIPNTRVIRDMKRLDQMRQKEAGYHALAAQWDKSAQTEEDRRSFLAATADWNDLHNDISDLEHELHDQKPYKRLIKTD